MASKETLEEKSKKWNNGEHTYNEIEQALLNLKPGEKLGLVMEQLKNCTVCTVNNATCLEFFEFKIIIKGLHPTQPPKEHIIMICPLGVTNIDECALAK
jgi:hypothetical protein